MQIGIRSNVYNLILLGKFIINEKREIKTSISIALLSTTTSTSKAENREEEHAFNQSKQAFRSQFCEFYCRMSCTR